MIEAVAASNPNTIVVLETGNPVAMPWRDKVRAIVQAWYPGQAGATAIAEVLTGAVNPSGRTPITWPATANVVVHVGATPVFADVRAEDLNIDPQHAASLVGPRTTLLPHATMLQ